MQTTCCEPCQSSADPLAASRESPGETTNDYKPLQISPKQQVAVDLLITGKNDRETAETIGIHRVTVTKWRLHHPAFQAELNRRRADLWGAAAEKLRALLPKALRTLEQELDDHQHARRAAVALIRLAGLTAAEFGAAARQQLDAEEIIAAQVQERIEKLQADRERYQTVEEDVRLSRSPSLRRQRDETDWHTARNEVLAGIERQLAEHENAHTPESAD